MVKLLLLIKRRPDITREESNKIWREQHGPLCVSTPAFKKYVRKYVQNYPLPDEPPKAFGKHAMEANTLSDFDGICELHFDTVEDADAFWASEDYLEKIKPHEPNFGINGDHPDFVSAWMLVEENEMFP